MPPHRGWLALLALLHIGCDGVVGSGRVRDACGECGGNNSTCQIISGIFTEPYLKPGYRPVAQIPAGACSVQIEELGHTKNYLALRDSKGQYIINGDWKVDLSGVYPGAGTIFTYQRQNEKNTENTAERISTRGPTTEPVRLDIIYRQANRGIKYEYTIKRNASVTSLLPQLPGSGAAKLPPDQQLPRDAPVELIPGRGFVSPLYQSPSAGNALLLPSEKLAQGGQSVPEVAHSAAATRRGRRRRRKPKFQWIVTGYTECSRSCGEGTKTTKVVCMRKRRNQLAAERDCNEAKRPKPTTITCNTRPCAARWEASGWTECSVTCGVGQYSRTYSCVRDGQPVSESECPGLRPPSDTQPCQQPPCLEGLWQIGAWTPCSVTCGRGTRHRNVTCQPSIGQCPEATRPQDTEICDQPSCDVTESQGEAQPEALAKDGWMVTEWEELCSVDCGQGVQWRQVTCLGSCDDASKPDQTRPCKSDRACAGMWFTGPWSRCSHACGPGVQSRTVTCLRSSDGQLQVAPQSACPPARPGSGRACSGADCGGRWHRSAWTGCSASCGRGSQSRAVLCVADQGAQTDTCAETDRPKRRRACLLPDCSTETAGGGRRTRKHHGKQRQRQEETPPSDQGTGAKTPAEACTDKFDNCLMVQQARLCKYKYYKTACCASCKSG